MKRGTRRRAAGGAGGAASRRRLPAGDFLTWLRRTRRALRARGTADVPCDGCTACCTSSYFIHVGPGEHRSLARIPKPLLFRAPGLARGNLLLGYDAHGRCPMLEDGRCSIYDARPQTCRAFDCRLFAATGVAAGGHDKTLINRRARRWRFRYGSQTARATHRAVQAAAAFLKRHARQFPAGFVPRSPTPLALVALEVYEALLGRASGGTGGPGRTREIVAAVLAAKDARRGAD